MAGLTEPEELRFLNIWGLVRESVKVLLSHTKLFIALTLTLILPLCVVGLGHHLITEPIANRISWDEIELSFGQPNAHAEQRINRDLHRELSKLFIFLVIYILSLFAFSLLSTSAIVYSVACIYSEKITSYKTVLSVVPRVWKRLIVTFLWALLITVSYGIVCVVLILLVGVIFSLISQGSEIVIELAVWGGFVGFFVGAIYFSCVWHLASVVTVLEEGYGIGAMRKSLKLMKGRQIVAFCLFFMYSVAAFVIGWSFGRWVLHGGFHGVHSTAWRAVLGCVLILCLSFVDLMGFLLQTIFYFACKAHHHESIDRLQLSEHLGAYLGEYAPLRGSIQLEAFEA